MKNPKWEELKPVAQSLGEKMLRAKWAKAFALKDDDIVFTGDAVRLKRLRRLWFSIKDLKPHTLTDAELDFLVFLTAAEAKRRGWK